MFDTPPEEEIRRKNVTQMMRISEKLRSLVRYIELIYIYILTIYTHLYIDIHMLYTYIRYIRMP